ncbi:DNA mismatch repair protein MutL [Planktothrix agardhii]|uniref:DNA mismatch repair endonuclease MutL n=3 Tax=Planktothrix agardhii TaxID=1160 RepID=UPI001F41B281|nr:DNA mismatch repair endonuclease MutL [Planktothrix agardhii]MCF3575652.1 DNA mismatch repair endonuclease MutL [Planktothrix agardhii 1812]MCF3575662.1 DNA mismatch repair endonuclease MutL [Planktothrix agardhii 1812]MCF3580525.1 DNA mismatch repair endonuclease MutL [Planktothrix agardhii 1811]CAD5958238.1 DNA mismatch repair protein MutL [Planktothrix agardhii]CAD5976636.1 DNA mismatch repair protein MutL [Planktothrix agardhii]
MNSIRPLPKDVVDLIAASEVIDSLVAVVRELVENALDAQANRITISVWPESWRVQVVDNGLGMDLTNLEQAAVAHSTSKINTITDLFQINSLGFRGEALHSLAQLSDLEIISRPSSPSLANSGWRISYNHQGEVVKTETIAVAQGTVITVSNLFENWQNRRQSLPASAQQLRGIQLIIQQIALCHPQVTWQLRQGNNPWFQISPGVNAQQILPQIIKNIQFSDLFYLKIPPDYDNINLKEIELILGLPDRASRRRPDWVKVAINGRMVRSPELEQTLLTALARTCPRDRYPICFVHLHLFPEQIDWNRNPDKSEVYLQNLNQWQELISQGIEQALRLNFERISPPQNRIEKLLKVSEEKGSYNINSETQLDATSCQTELGILEIKAIAQVLNTYIIAEHSSGLWLIEQHIAHERILYEQICDQWRLIPLEPSIILQSLSTAQLEQMQRLGLEVDPFGDGVWVVRNAPELLIKRSDCSEALLELSLGGDLQTAQVATACRSAIKNGTPLSLTQMQTILDQWMKTRNPRTCPHGRPIVLQLEESALSRFFRRNWVIGKSHGI